MIAKHIPIKVANKQSYARLVNYLVNKQGVVERVGRVVVTNCYAKEPVSAVLEIEYTQDRNTRARSDKTYHLVISFEAGEMPHDHVLDDIEAELCQAIGLGEHQRISVAHTDTEHFHVHLAINKIHPVKFTMIEPYRDFWKLGQACEMLEARHGLSITNHQSNRPSMQSAAANIDHHAQMQSLEKWMKINLLLPLQGCDDWQSFHKVLRSYGLEIVERGNGFVFRTLSSKEAIVAVKASSIDRSLSKQRLIERLGRFEFLVDANVQVQSVYQKKLADPSKESLYRQYQVERQSLLSLRKQRRYALHQWKQDGFVKQKQYFDAKRKLIKTVFKYMRPQIRHLLIKSAFNDYLRELDRIKELYVAQNNSIKIEYSIPEWKQWQRNKQSSMENGKKDSVIVAKPPIDIDLKKSKPRHYPR